MKKISKTLLYKSKLHKIRFIAVIFSLLTTGFAAMVYEVILMREVSIVLGSTLFASSSILSVVMVGLFAGSWLFGKIVNEKNSLLQLVIIEFSIAIISLFQVLLIRNLLMFDSWTLKFALSGLLVFPPAFFMGGEIPVAIQLTAPSFPKDKIGEISGKIYAADTFGGALGALLTPFILVQYLGCLKSTWFGGLLNVISGMVLLFFFYHLKDLKKESNNE